MGAYNSTFPSIPHHSKKYSSDSNAEHLFTHSLMGLHPPPLYEAAVVGNWPLVLHRAQVNPVEISYCDKSKNTAIHLACRSQPPVNVVVALLKAEDAVGGFGKGGGVRRTTMDGLTTLHFACYCGASSQVIDILIATDEVRSKSVLAAMDTAASTNERKVGRTGGRGMRSFSISHSTSSKSVNSVNRGPPSSPLLPSNVAIDGKSHPFSNSNSESQIQSTALPPTIVSIRDRRGRTPLHCACAGFRTPHRPAVIRSLLRSDPKIATAVDEKGRTAFSLMYADYAEEIEEVLNVDVSMEEARRACGLTGNNDKRGGAKLRECWIILKLLLRAAHLGSVPAQEQEEDFHRGHFPQRARSIGGNIAVEEKINANTPNSPNSLNSLNNQNNQNNLNISDFSHEPKFESQTPSSRKIFHTSRQRSFSDESNEVDLNYTPFQILHAASACLYYIPRGFFRLIMKVMENPALSVRERDADFRLPLHLAVRAVPPLPLPPVASASDGGSGEAKTSQYAKGGGRIMGNFDRGGGNKSTTTNSINGGNNPACVMRGSMFTTTSTSNGQALYQFSDGMKISIHYCRSSAVGRKKSDVDGINRSRSLSFSSVDCSVASTDTNERTTPKHKSHRNNQNLQQQYINEEQSSLPIIIPTLLNLYPEAASIPDDNETGKYPLLSALESGKPYNEVIEPLVESFPQLLMEEEFLVGGRLFGHHTSAANADDDMAMGHTLSVDEVNPASSGSVGTMSTDSGSGHYKNRAWAHSMAHGGRVPSSSSPNCVKAVHASIMTGLTSQNPVIRNTSANTVRHLMERWGSHGEESNGSSHSSSSSYQYQVDDFVRGLIKASGRYGSANARFGQFRANNFNEPNKKQRRSTIGTSQQQRPHQHQEKNQNKNDEWAGIQSSMLHALSSAMIHAPLSSIRVPDTPKLALDTAYSMLRHEDGVVRDGAARVLAAALQILDWELGEVVVGSVILGRRGSLNGNSAADTSAKGVENIIGGVTGLWKRNSFVRNDSMHSVISTSTTVSSAKMRDSMNLGLTLPVASSATIIEETVPMRHGKAAACYRILSSPLVLPLLNNHSSYNNDVSQCNDLLHEITLLVCNLLLDPSPTVRKVGCLSIGPILSHITSLPSSSPSNDAALRDLSFSILKCMRPTEDPDVHFHLARALLSAARHHHCRENVKHQHDQRDGKDGQNMYYFVTSSGTPILEGALMLASSSPVLAVRGLFGAFLWVALGMDSSGGCRQRRGEGLARYMELAEGENGKIMMGLVTKSLVRIHSVVEDGW